MGNEKVRAYLGLGSNLGERESNLANALGAIGRFPTTRLLGVSPMYRSAPWGPVQQPDFLNLVAEIETALDPHTLLSLCKQTEQSLGRVEGVRWGPRPIDIDILLYDELSLRSKNLQIPHARLWERAFVLRPLADLRPDLRDPGGRPIISLLESEEIASQEVRPFASRIEPGNEEHV